MYEKGNQLTVLSYTLQNQSDAVDSNSELYFQAIADQVEESYAANQTAVDIETPTFISNVIDKAETASATTLSPEVKTNLNTVLATTIPLLRVYPDASTTASVQRFAFSTLQDDVQDSTVIGSSTSATLEKYENDVVDYVATDQSIEAIAINAAPAPAPTSAPTPVPESDPASVPATDPTLTPTPDPTSTPDPTPTPNQAPTISSSATFSVAENNVAIGTVSASDPDGDSLTYSILGSEINISSSGSLSFASAPDYETKNSYTATVTVSDGSASDTQNITVNVTDVDETVPNEAPTISSSATFSAAENQTSIGSVSASDPDGDSLTYSVSGSEVNISSSGVLTFASAPDYETKNSYTATVTVSDGTASTTQNITVNVTDVAENQSPTINSSATFSAVENQTSIGSVSASDPDGDSLTYSTSGSEINISSSGTLTFASAPDYETKNSYTTTVTVSDGTASVTQNITVSILDVNETPSFSSFSSNVTADENQTSVATVSGSDFENNSLSYSLSGDDSSSLSINSSSGVITFNSSPDYETTNYYSAVVNITDGNSSISRSLYITISDTNDDPILTVPSSITMDETNISGCFDTTCNVTTASGSDQDAGSSLSFSLSGTDQSYFSISSGGLITFNRRPDYEEKPSYSIVVNLSDGNGGTDSENLTVNLNNKQDTCVFTNNSPYYVDTGTSAVASWASVEGCGWTLQNNQYDSSSFSITSNGVLSFNSAPDAATKSYYQVYVTHEDDANCCSLNYILTVYVNGNFISALPGTYDANTYVTQDNITGGYGNDVIYTYDGDDTLNGGRGADILWGGAGDNTLTGGSEKINGEPHPVDKFAIKLGCSAEGNWDDVGRVVDFQDTIDKILLLDGLAFEDLTITGNLTTNPIYIRAGNKNLLEISHNQLNQQLNSRSMINLTSDDFITGSSGTTYCDNVAPTISSSATFSAAENQTSIGGVSASDHNGDSLTYSISGSEVNISSSGVLTFASAPDYETKNSYSATVTVSDGTASTTQNITVNVTDVNE
jgi:hypothetical protein